MTEKQVREARQQIEDAGHPDERERQRAREQVVAEAVLETLAAERNSCAAEYRRYVSAWLGEALSVDAPIMTLTNEQHQARQYLIGGLIAIGAECGLAWWTFETRWGVPGYYGAVVAAASALILHAVLGLWYEIGSTTQPRGALRRLRRGALRFGGIGLLLGIVTGVVARCVEGSIALDLLPILNAGLAITTVSLLITTAALFCAATIHGTSARLANRYHRVSRRYRRTKAFLDTIAKTASSLTRTAVMLLPLLLIAMIAQTGCGRADLPAPAVAPATTISDACVLDVMVDTSGSVVGLKDAWHNVLSELPLVAERFACTEITFLRTDIDGWSPTPVHTITLSAYEVASTDDTGNLLVFLKARREQIQKKRKTQIEAGLQQLQAKALLPGPDHESPASDIVGVIQRVANTYSQHLSLTIYLTDAADTQYQEFPSIPAPPANVRLLVLLAPADSRDSSRTTRGHIKSAAQQYEFRSAQLKTAAPWIKVAPSYARDIASLLQ